LKKLILFFFLVTNLLINAQSKKIKIIFSEINFVNEEKYPGATILVGNVKMAHEGATLNCQG